VSEKSQEAESQNGLGISVKLRLAILAGMAPLLSVVLTSSSGRDDAFITYEAARNLAAYGQLLNINGDKLEQSSSLLQVLILATGSFVTHISLPWLGWASSLFGAYFLALFVGCIAERLRTGSGWIATLLCVGATPLLYWASSGLETTIAAAILAAVVLVSLDVVGVRLRSHRRVAVLLGLVALMAMIRPEGALVLISGFLASAVAMRLGARRFAADTRPAVRDLLLLAGVAALCLALLVVFRLAYFGVPFPQPVIAKTNLSVARIGDGLGYLRTSSDLSVAVVVLFACVGGWSLRRSQWMALSMIVSFVLASLGFVVLSGGDWMELGRFICVPLALLSVLAGVGVRSLRLTSSSRFAGVTLAALVLVLFAGSAIVGLGTYSLGSPIWADVTWSDPQMQTARGSWVETKNQPHRRDIPAAEALRSVIDALAAGGVRPVTVGSVQAGAVVFNGFPSEFGVARFIDVRALTTDDFMACNPTPPRSTFGLDFDSSPWIKGTSICGVEPPDVVLHFGAGQQPKPKDKYVITFRQGGVIGRGPLVGSAGTGQWIAVRKDLKHLVP
jgi:hypothetical protein